MNTSSEDPALEAVRAQYVQWPTHFAETDLPPTSDPLVRHGLSQLAERIAVDGEDPGKLATRLQRVVTNPKTAALLLSHEPDSFYPISKIQRPVTKTNDTSPDSPFEQLTSRQLEVIARLHMPFSNIARELNTTRDNIRVMISQLVKRVNRYAIYVHDPMELAVVAAHPKHQALQLSEVPTGQTQGLGTAEKEFLQRRYGSVTATVFDTSVFSPPEIEAATERALWVSIIRHATGIKTDTYKNIPVEPRVAAVLKAMRDRVIIVDGSR